MKYIVKKSEIFYDPDIINKDTIITTDKKFITFLKLRLEFVATGEFECPNNEITDPLKVE